MTFKRFSKFAILGIGIICLSVLQTPAARATDDLSKMTVNHSEGAPHLKAYGITPPPTQLHSYTFHDGTVASTNGPEMGQRSGAHSRPYVSGSHGQLPERYTIYNYGSAYNDVKEQIRHNSADEAGSMLGPSYSGETLLAPGTWTGEPLMPPQDYHTIVWKQDARDTFAHSDGYATGAKTKSYGAMQSR